MEASDVQSYMTAKQSDPSLLDISGYLRPKNTVGMKNLITNFQNNSLEPVTFERLDSIRLSWSKYLMTSFVDMTVYMQSSASLIAYCHLLLPNVWYLMENTYPKMINMKRDQ